MDLVLRRWIAPAALLWAAAFAHGQLYGVDYDSGRIYRIDTTNATLTQVGNPGITNIADLVLGEDGNVYGYTTGNNATLYRYNPTTWAATKVGALGNGFFFEGALAINDDGVVYGANFGTNVNDFMFTLNLATGAATTGPQLGGFPHDFNGFDFRSDGELVGIDREDNALWQIDVSNGNLIQVAALNPTLGEVGGMATLGNTSYFCTAGPGGVLAGTNQLFTINESTGATTLVGGFGATINGTGISGLVAINPAPEPASLLALGGLAALAARKRRTRKEASK
ncbi:MAG TPA: PEP-CTERM sorting domain-containing protein [Fimbriimonadaceae bacterium]|nr:PEP-CTERM sorting domain-containing protein [Fimbriimonadaceae bacterium]